MGRYMQGRSPKRWKEQEKEKNYMDARSEKLPAQARSLDPIRAMSFLILQRK
jgi:hypothetical protein